MAVKRVVTVTVSCDRCGLTRTGAPSDTQSPDQNGGATVIVTHWARDAFGNAGGACVEALLCRPCTDGLLDYLSGGGAP